MLKNLFYILFVAVIIIPGCRKQEEKKKATASRDFQAAEYYDYYQKKDSAFYFYNRVINNSHDSLEKGKAYWSMGLQQLEAGDYNSAQGSFLSSIKTLDEKDTSHYGYISASYNSLANATLELKEYDSAISNYNLAFKFALDSNKKLHALNNLGVAYQKKGDYEKAIEVFDSIILTPVDTSMKARTISNSARTKWLADSNYNALPEFMTALTLRRLVNNSLGVSTSFDHLSDYYANSRPDSAFFYALKRLEILQTFKNPNDRYDVLGQLIMVSPPGQTKKYAVQYIELNDSLIAVRSNDRNQYALIKYDAEKSKTENLSLKKHIGNQRQIIWNTVLFATLLILALIIRARIKRKRLKREAETAIRESRLKTSQKIHDVVANGLYRIMNELEHRETIDKEPLLNKIEGLYEKSRDISYEDIPVNNDDYGTQINQLLTSFANDRTNVITVGNQQTFWNKVTAFQKQELQLVLGELMINMQKHSRAKNVVVHFKQENDTGYIHYKDDGLGFRSGAEHGNGLNNTVNRIKSIKGQINFEKNGEGGVSILISFPLELL